MNKQVSFYILNSSTDKQQFACRLVEKAYYQKKTVFIYCEDETQAHQFDDELWSFKRESFIPHNIQGEGPVPAPPIQIGFKDNASGFSNILLNLSLKIPSFHPQFQRIIEIVDDTESVKQTRREHYRYYQSQSYNINYYKI